MGARNRSRQGKTYNPGYKEIGRYINGVWTVNSTVLGSSLDNWKETCADSTQPPPYTSPQALALEKHFCIPLVLSGEYKSPTSVWSSRFYNYNIANWTGWQYVSGFTPTGFAWWKSKALASINPNRPDVDLPLFLFELKDLPRMLQGLGNVLNGRSKPGDVPGGHLAITFGWVPLISDLYKLATLQELLDRRMRDLRSLSMGKKYKRTLGSSSFTVDGGVIKPDGVNGPHFRVTTTQTERAWMSARVKLLDPLPSSQELPELARRLTLGLDGLSSSTIWNSIPWSWMIDWFSNFGDMMEARRGNLRWTFSDLCLMRTHQLKSTATPVYLPGSTGASGGVKTYTGKYRSVSIGDSFRPSWRPILSGSHQAILASLVTAAALRAAK